MAKRVELINDYDKRRAQKQDDDITKVLGSESQSGKKFLRKV